MKGRPSLEPLNTRKMTAQGLSDAGQILKKSGQFAGPKARERSLFLPPTSGVILSSLEFSSLNTSQASARQWELIARGDHRRNLAWSWQGSNRSRTAMPPEIQFRSAAIRALLVRGMSAEINIPTDTTNSV
jgi:hypothetical protein